MQAKIASVETFVVDAFRANYVFVRELTEDGSTASAKARSSIASGR